VSLNLNDKKAVVAEVSEQVASAQTIVVAEYRGIQVGHLTQLRANARAQGVYLRVLKNTLARRAVEGTPFASLASEMTGPLIYSISKDAVAAAKVINDFAKSNDKLVVRAGNYAGKSLDKAGITAFEELAQLKQSMDADMRAARDKLVADERNLTSRQGQMPAAEFNAGTADLLKRAQDLAALTRTRESQVTRTWDGVVAQIRQAAQGQMSASAAAHHCAMILDRGAGYHVGAGMDLTGDVTQRLNGVMPAVNLQLAPPA